MFLYIVCSYKKRVLNKGYKRPWGRGCQLAGISAFFVVSYKY